MHIGRYAVGEPLGRGAIGEVRAALDLEDGAPVAVKLLTAETARRPDAAELFAREVRAVARLNHPSVVRIFDQGVLDASCAEALGLPAGSPWFSMERAEGSAQRAQRSWEGLRELLLDLLDALAYCHARDLVHRDLKPQNVLRCGSAWKLADFGLALPVDALTDRVSGTPLYMPPEQFDRPGEVGPWSDLYALGCVAWARATGYPPFLGDARGLQRAHTSAPLPDFEAQFPVPDGLRAWVGQALAKDPARRWDHAADARRDLLAIGPVPEVRVRPIEPSHAGSGLVGVRELPCIGRDAELAALDQAFAEALTGGPRALIVEGPAGAGKTFLARHAAREAAAAGRVRLIEVHHAPDDGGDGLVELAARLVRRPRCPVTGDDRAVLEAWVDFHSPTPPEDDRRLALTAAARALCVDRPLLILADDLQWGPETLGWLEDLLGDGVGPLFVLATERLEPGRPSALPAGWARLRVGGLRDADAERLAAEVLGEGGVRAVQLAEISRGNPLLAVQLALHFTQTGKFALPSDPLRGWSARLAGILGRSPDVEAPLRLAAVVGGEGTLAEWDGLARGVSLAPLVRAGLVEELPDGWRLAHPLLVDAVRARTPDAVWSALSGRAAEELEDADPLRRARLWLGAGQGARALDLALAVRQEARDRLDDTRARRALEIAEACAPDAPHDRARLRAAQAWEHLVDAEIDAARELTAGLEQLLPAEGWHLRGVLALLTGDEAGAEFAFGEALARTPADPGALDAGAHLAVRLGRYERAHSLLAALEAVARSPWQLARIERQRARLAVAEGRLDEAIVHAERAERMALDSACPGLAAYAQQLRAEALLLADRPAEAEVLVRQVLARRGRSVDASARLALALALLDTGHPARAEALIRGFLDVATDVHGPLRVVAWLALARIRAEQGDVDLVPELLDRIAPTGGTAPSWPREIPRQIARLADALALEPALSARVRALGGR